MGPFHESRRTRRPHFETSTKLSPPRPDNQTARSFLRRRLFPLRLTDRSPQSSKLVALLKSLQSKEATFEQLADEFAFHFIQALFALGEWRCVGYRSCPIRRRD